MLVDTPNTTWLKLLPYALMLLRSLPLNSDGVTANRILFGHDLRLPNAIHIEDPLPHPSLRSYIDKMKHNISLPFKSPNLQSNKNIFIPKQLHQSKFFLVKDTQYGRNKLHPVYTGPFKTIKINKNNVYLMKDGKVSVENIRNVKPLLSVDDNVEYTANKQSELDTS